MSFGDGSIKGWARSFWEHADELVSRFKILLVALIITTSIGWLPTNLAGITNPIGGYQPLLSLLMLRVKQDFLPNQATLIAGEMAYTVFIYAYLSILVGLLLASPVILYEVFKFVEPALYENEKKALGSYAGVVHWASRFGLYNGVFPHNPLVL